MKTIKDQGERQIKAIQNQWEIKGIKKYSYNDKDSPMILKQREILNKFVDERLYEITELDEKVNTDDLMYRYEGKTADEKFDEFDNGKISLADAKNDPAEFKSSLSEIKKEIKGAKKHFLQHWNTL